MAVMKHSLHKRLLLLLILFIGASLLSRAYAQDSQTAVEPPAAVEPKPGEGFGYGVGSVLASVIYSPLKVTYAGLGLMTGGLGYLLSAGRPDVANNIIYPAILGDYVITPGHLKGQEPVVFIGPPPPEPTMETSQAATTTIR
jgi:hypothetical protein